MGIAHAQDPIVGPAYVRRTLLWSFTIWGPSGQVTEAIRHVDNRLARTLRAHLWPNEACPDYHECRRTFATPRDGLPAHNFGTTFSRFVFRVLHDFSLDSSLPALCTIFTDVRAGESPTRPCARPSPRHRRFGANFPQLSRAWGCGASNDFAADRVRWKSQLCWRTRQRLIGYVWRIRASE